MMECAGIKIVGDMIVACKNINAEMLDKYAAQIRREIIGEIGAFAADYHHHIDGRDVVIVEQLLAFLTPIDNQGSVVELEGKGKDGLGTT